MKLEEPYDGRLSQLVPIFIGIRFRGNVGVKIPCVTRLAGSVKDDNKEK